MNREVHVRVCEGLRGKFPRPTRLEGFKTSKIPVITIMYLHFTCFSDIIVRHKIFLHGQNSALLQLSQTLKK